MPKRKYEGTLRRIEIDARTGYKQFERSVAFEEKYPAHYYFKPRREHGVDLENATSLNGASAAAILAAAEVHYNRYPAEYHDLAVLTAYHDRGMQIRVEQPLQIGQQV